MAKLVGGFLRTLATIFYFLDFLCAGLIIAVFSYFLAKLSYHHMYISNDWRAVEGLSGSAVLYAIFAVLLTCFLGGHRLFAFLGIVFDLLFCGAMVAIAVLCRHGAHKCTGNVITPLGSGPANSNSAGTNLGTACKLNTACFATAVAGAVFFLMSAILQVFVARHHQKEKKYGPSPANDYTSGSGKRKFFQRKPKDTTEPYDADAEMVPVAAPAATHLAAPERVDMRPSHDTAYTGTTMGQNEIYGNANKYEAPVTKYEPPAPVVPAATTSHQGPNLGPNGVPIVSSTTTTIPGYYDPYYTPNRSNQAAGPALNY